MAKKRRDRSQRRAQARRQDKETRRAAERRLPAPGSPEHDALVEAWAQAPDDAQTGRCNDPECPRVKCLDPWVTATHIRTQRYVGPLVVLAYVDPQELQRIRVNGEDVVVLNEGDPALQLVKACTHVDALYGDAAGVILRGHLLRRHPDHEGPSPALN